MRNFSPYTKDFFHYEAIKAKTRNKNDEKKMKKKAEENMILKRKIEENPIKPDYPTRNEIK